MPECSVVRESMTLLLTESLDPATREAAHSHIETCAACSEEWSSVKETWLILGDLPQVEVPARVEGRFLETVGVREAQVIPFRRRPAAKWLAQAAAVVVLAGGGYFAGHRHRTASVEFAADGRGRAPAAGGSASSSIAETRVIPAAAVSPNIEGRPDIGNVQFVDADPSDGDIGVSFDVTQHVTVTGNPSDKSMVRLLAYVLQNDAKTSASRSQTIDWVRPTYSEPRYTNPAITEALAAYSATSSTQAFASAPSTRFRSSRQGPLSDRRRHPRSAHRRAQERSESVGPHQGGRSARRWPVPASRSTCRRSTRCGRRRRRTTRTSTSASRPRRPSARSVRNDTHDSRSDPRCRAAQRSDGICRQLRSD